jgi:hypothetical protein
MNGTDRWTRPRFLKHSAAAAAGFALTGRALVDAGRASGSFFMCEFLNCAPVAYTCYQGTLYLIWYCYDAFSGWYCGSYWDPVGCCKG